MTPRHLAITMGDPAGIGPEIIVRACSKLRARLDSGDLRLLIIGSGPALKRAQAELGSELDIPEVRDSDAEWPSLCFLQADAEGEPIEPGKLSADGGRFAFKAVEQGVRFAQSGRVGGIVTAPLNKEALNKAGYHYPGHTEMLAELTGARSG
jgi:4-hydroxy-L-threonine phosphate dehydrogenase PdxA